MPLVFITDTRTSKYLCNAHKSFFGHIYNGWRIGQCNWYRSSCVFRTIYQHQVSPWSGTAIFGDVIQLLGQKYHRKLVIWGFAWISRRHRVAFPNCLDLRVYALLCHGQRFQFSSPNLQWLTKCFIRCLADPARTYLGVHRLPRGVNHMIPVVYHYVAYIHIYTCSKTRVRVLHF